MKPTLERQALRPAALITPFHSGTRTFLSRDAGITHFSHIGLYTRNPAADEAFWSQVLSARTSD